MTDMPLIEVEGLTKRFDISRSLTDIVTGHRPQLQAVSNVAFALRRGETLGIVGESGCGKTTLGRMLIKLIRSEFLIDAVGLNKIAGQPFKVSEVQNAIESNFRTEGAA